jgi:hypothetical protein
MTESARETGRRQVSRAPIIILTYGTCGEQRLQSLLERASGVFCTRGTGIIPACHMALQAWRQADGLSPAGKASPLAVRSVRGMADGMITVLTTRHGGRRWCETSTADPQALDSFLKVVPGTHVICLHRSCEDFVFSVLNASPWRVSERRFTPSIAANPDSPITAISSWWVARSKSLLAFEQRFSDSCVRMLFEDLELKPDSVIPALSQYLEIDFPEDRAAGRDWAWDERFPMADRPRAAEPDFPPISLIPSWQPK